MKLLTLNSTILAQGVFVDDGENIRTYTPEGVADTVYPKHVIKGSLEVDVDVPEGFTCAGYTWDGTAVQVKVLPVPTSSVIAAIAKTYTHVDAIYAEAIGNRATEYSEAEDAALAYQAAGYTGAVSPYVSDWAQANPTGQVQSDQWAANAILAQANAFRAAQLAMRSTRFVSQKAMRAAATEAALSAAVAQWIAFINQVRAQLGLLPIRE